MQYSIRVLILVPAMALFGWGCAGESGGPNPDDSSNSNQNGGATDGSTSGLIPLADFQAVGFESALAVIYIHVLDNQRIVQQASQPCPFGGTRVRNEDDSFTLTDCSIFPELTLNGGLAFTPQKGDTQGFLLTADHLVGFDGTTEFMLDGFIQEIENADGSLTFVMDFFSATSSTLRCTTRGCTDAGVLDTPESTALAGRIDIASDFTVTGDWTGRDGSACSFTGQNLIELVAEGNQGLDRTCFYPPLDGCVVDMNCEIECRPPFADPDPDCTPDELCTAHGLCDGVNANDNGSGGSGNTNDNTNENGGGPLTGDPCIDTPTRWGGFRPNFPRVCFGDPADMIFGRSSAIGEDEAHINFPVQLLFEFSEFTSGSQSLEDSNAVLNGQVLTLTADNFTTTDQPNDTLTISGGATCGDLVPSDQEFIVRYRLTATDACDVILNGDSNTPFTTSSITCCGQNTGILCRDSGCGE